jgi:hypothetical protein
VLIPRNIKGGELTAEQINAQFDVQEKTLRETEFGRELVHFIDRSFADMKRPTSFSETAAAFFISKILSGMSGALSVQRFLPITSIMPLRQLSFALRRHVQHSFRNRCYYFRSRNYFTTGMPSTFRSQQLCL